MLLSLLGVIDLIAAGMLWFGTGLINSLWVVAFASFFILKGIWSVFSAAIGGFWLDVLGWADLLTSIFLFLIYFGVLFDVIKWFGIIMAAKGIWSVIMDLS